MKDLITSWSEVPVVLDLPFAGELLGLTPNWLKKRSQKGKFPAYKISERSWRVNKDDLLEWIEEQKITNYLKD